MLQKLRLYIYNHLGFSKSEANGLILVIAFSVLFFIIPSLYIRFFVSESELPPPSKEIKEWAKSLKKRSEPVKTENSPLASTQNKTASTSENKRNKSTETQKSFISFQFDPNQVSIDSLEKLGFEPYIATRIDKYREAGGSFRNKNDLFNIYGIDSLHVISIWDYIALPEKTEKKQVYEVKKSDLNSVNSNTLMNIPGVGKVFSERIIKYRDLLGGFYNLRQLSDVYNLPDSTVELISNNYYVRSSAIRKLDINELPEDSLRKHPYISYNLASIIVNYRLQHGHFKSVEELNKIKVIEKELLDKISPYISIGN